MNRTNLFAIGLLCLLAAACGSVEGGYEGYADVTGGMYGRGEKILSIVAKKDGDYTIDFPNSNFLKNCRLKIYLQDLKKAPSGGGQRCDLNTGYESETLKVESAEFIDTSNAGLKAFKVFIKGKKSSDGSDVQIIYEGFNSK